MKSSTIPLPHEQPAGPSTRPATRWLIDFLWTLPFFVLFWVNIAHHQLWRDELNAWAIAVASPTLWSLASHVHFEGHPWLWYFVLWVPSRFTAAPVAMKWVEAAIGTAIYLVIGLKSPFTRMEKALVLLGYFIVFEYTVMSRMYGMMLLCVLLYAWRRAQKPNGVIGIAAILGAMANTDLTGIVLSGALLLEYAYTSWREQRDAGESAISKRQIAALLLYCALLAISVASLWPAKGIDLSGPGHPSSASNPTSMMFQPRHIARGLVNVTAAPWWPISEKFPRRFWGVDAEAQHGLAYLMLVVLLAYWHCFRRERSPLLLIGLAVAFAFLVSHVVYVGGVRHWGITYIAFLVGIWGLRDRLNKTAAPGPAPRLPASAYVLLGLSAVAGLTAVGSSWTHPFSQSAAATQWLKEHHLADAALVGEPDSSFAAVAEQLQRPVYFMECACVDTYKLFAAARKPQPEEELPDRMALAAKNLKTDQLIFLFYRPLEAEEIQELGQRSLSVSKLVVFDGADEKDENYYIYRITKAVDSPRSSAASGHD